MRGAYIIGILIICVVIGGGLFLLSRDGTEEYVRAEANADRALSDRLSATLPTSEDASSTPSEGVELESEADTSATTTPLELPDEAYDTTVVTYTDAGFSPKTIHVTAGDTVVFMNESSRNMWVASAVHPTHNEYPVESDADCLGSSFDSCIGIPRGQSWSFTFDVIGEWGYHDHLRASRTGTVIVE